MTTAQDLLELIAEYIAAKEEGDANALQSIAQRFDVALGESVIDRASIQSEA